MVFANGAKGLGVLEKVTWCEALTQQAGVVHQIVQRHEFAVAREVSKKLVALLAVIHSLREISLVFVLLAEFLRFGMKRPDHEADYGGRSALQRSFELENALVRPAFDISLDAVL